MYTSFWNNIHFQKQPHLSNETLFQHFKFTYESKNWSNIGSFNYQGSAPYPYMNRKFKDLNRTRGIISYFHHPLKDIYFKAAAGLMTCLKALDFFHTNLFNPLQALPTMKLLFLYLNNWFGSETVFHSWAADVKEMYDWFPQADILRAVKWALSYVSKNYRRNSVAVFFKSTNKAELENPILLMKRWIFLFKIFSQFVNLKYPMNIFLWTVLFSFNCLDAPREDQDHRVLAWLYAYFMNISLDAAFMTIWPSCFSFVILTTSEQLLSIDPQTSPQNPLPSHFWTNFKLKPTILPCLWFLKSVRKTRLNFLKENLLLQMILCLVSGCQKTLTHSNNHTSERHKGNSLVGEPPKNVSEN